MKKISLLLMIWLAGTGLATAAGFEILAPHRAVYEVSLDAAEDRSGIQSMDGRIVYEITGNACEGIAIRYRFVTRINTGSETFVTDQQTASFESSNGKEFSFQTKSFVNEAPDQVISGNASRNENGIAVNIKKPEERHLDLPDGIFTSSHLIEVIKKAREGEVFVSHDVFDGSGTADSILKSASVIGKQKTVSDTLKGEAEDSVEPFRKDGAWPITMSYFKTVAENTEESVPIYEASFLLYENGVTRQLMMRYPDYSLRASLREIEFFENSPCRTGN